MKAFLPETQKNNFLIPYQTSEWELKIKNIKEDGININFILSL